MRASSGDEPSVPDPATRVSPHAYFQHTSAVGFTRGSAHLKRRIRGGDGARYHPWAPTIALLLVRVFLRGVLLIFVLLLTRLLAGDPLPDPGHPAATEALSDRFANPLDARGNRLAHRRVLDGPLDGNVVLGEWELVRPVRPDGQGVVDVALFDLGRIRLAPRVGPLGGELLPAVPRLGQLIDLRLGNVRLARPAADQGSQGKGQDDEAFHGMPPGGGDDWSRVAPVLSRRCNEEVVSKCRTPPRLPPGRGKWTAVARSAARDTAGEHRPSSAPVSLAALRATAGSLG